ncbi:MAG: NYN domain-containing protein, partial [Chloroflexi bacterium]|nr:NYN domain-containing protein [Chloroflexota bacterium]
MSKNVAVFVDVANIFYAAKAAGVDIDYVTLLKSAIAGRDFVRAYAYTGLDPENENQRQFHSFLARSGYKVVSKDIRKYGDGKIKANLDIELVVDMMKTARNLDVAVVVSGDGDFAPAIRAVQETGVRVEVISFRGNTSSDLMEVADIFTDIAQIARVEKGGRSGRRVAADDDLSMTEVPDKETEGASRRRGRGRGRTFERPAASRPAEVQVDIEGPAAAATTSMPGNLIVLPGERLSRAAATPGEGNGLESVEPEAAPAGEMEDAAETRNDDAGSAEGQRRRRRGGRGRGRGRGPERERETRPIAAASDEEEDEVLDEAPPRIPHYSTFGSVWDSQLGVATPPPVPGPPATAEEEEFEDEPEIPEYLLAERRQRGRTGGSGRGGPA